ncbi:MAG: hypothetical protein U1A77_19135 [Pirellulales bacterium]
MKRLVGIAIIVFCVASSAVADVPPPPPKWGFKRVPYENVVKWDNEIEGYRFFAFERLGIGGEEKIGEELKLGKEPSPPVRSSSSPSVRTGIVAAPGKLMEELGSVDKLADLLSRENEEKFPEGVVVFETWGETYDIKSSDPRSKVVNVITVSPDEKAGVKFTQGLVPPPTQSSGGGVAKLMGAPLATMFAGGAIAIAMAILGLRFVRKK